MFPSYHYFDPSSQYIGHFPQQMSTYHHQQTPNSISNDQTTIPLSSFPHFGIDQYTTALQQQHQERRNGRDMLLSMRKYRSLDSGQFLGQLDGVSASTAYKPDHSPDNPEGIFQHHSKTRQSAEKNFDTSQLLLMHAPAPFNNDYEQQQQKANYSSKFHPQMAIDSTIDGGQFKGGMGSGGNNSMRMPYNINTNNCGLLIGTSAELNRYDENNSDLLANNACLYYPPISAHSILQQIEFDSSALRREFSSICDRYNSLAATIQLFWVPELQRERQKRKEEALRADQLEQRLSQKNSETQILRVELDRHREEEASGIGRPLSYPRDFTDHTITLHEWQTLKSKLERSELSLAERMRELQNAEMRTKCAEEQKEEVERRCEILAKSNSLNEAQLKLLHEDLNVLRGKLELKNQQLETREKTNKNAEAKMDSLRMELKESQQTVQDSERRISQLTHRLDQMERETREQNSQMEILRQRLLQQPNTKAEIEFQQKLENALEDRRKLEQLIDQLRQQNEAEKQQQLQQFLQERDQLQANIAYLKKELADRHVLISSQSEKISQLDAAKNGINGNKFDEMEENVSSKDKEIEKSKGENISLLEEMEGLHREVDRLLKRIQQLEREKEKLMAKKEANNIFGASSEYFGAEMTLDDRVNSLRKRIRDLEEALHESVECTAEKDKSLSEQKRIVEKLSNQVNELFESSGNLAASTSQQRQTRDALAQLADTQKQLEEERQQRQRQITAIRKELGMALVAEKEAAISLIQRSCPLIESIPGLREKLDTLRRQKEALKHALLMSTTIDDPNNFGQQQIFSANSTNKLDASVLRLPPMIQSIFTTAAPHPHPSYAHSNAPPSSFTHPIRIQTTGYGGGIFGISAPASLNLYTSTSAFDNFGANQADEEGIWA